ncbi:hypothetical protein HZA86_04450 [Candidatus Uhrbacteria bacterium]|nr:hypothetical protein [Candidatus Uhrbacteria bacterium]
MMREPKPQEGKAAEQESLAQFRSVFDGVLQEFYQGVWQQEFQPTTDQLHRLIGIAQKIIGTYGNIAMALGVVRAAYESPKHEDRVDVRIKDPDARHRALQTFRHNLEAQLKAHFRANPAVESEPAPHEKLEDLSFQQLQDRYTQTRELAGKTFHQVHNGFVNVLGEGIWIRGDSNDFYRIVEIDPNRKEWHNYSMQHPQSVLHRGSKSKSELMGAIRAMLEELGSRIIE